jgi:hypothetical protein
MLKVHILTTCWQCNGETYHSVGEAGYCHSHEYTRYLPYPIFEGSGNELKWVDLEDFAKPIHWAACPHEHASIQGGMY